MATDNPNGRIPTPAWKWPDGPNTYAQVEAEKARYVSEANEQFNAGIARLTRDRDELLAALEGLLAQYRRQGYFEAETLIDADNTIARIKAGK